MNKLDLTKKLTDKQLKEMFVPQLLSISRGVGFKMSSRGWGYAMEQKGFITKDQFDKVEDAINRCRRKGYIPVDFVAEEKDRGFEEVHIPTDQTLPEHIVGWLDAAMNCDRHFSPDWWEGEKYYIQMVVEKVDLVSLFQPLCAQYHIPIANSKGWSSILQRAEYCRRFKAAEDNGLQCVLLYCGDHDPDGLRISDTLRANLEQIKDIVWDDDEPGYDPADLIIERFGLDYDFIIDNKLTWIDNLITGRGKNLADHRHPNYKLPYLQSYLKSVGERKCEANALVIAPQSGRDLCREAIERYLGEDSIQRFRQKRADVRVKIDEILDEVEVREPLQIAIDKLNRM